MICNNCKTRNENEAKFCFKCGSNLAEQTQAIFCAGCFEAFEENDNYCGWCGAPVVDGITEAEMVKRIANNEKEAIYQKAIILGANTPTIASYKASIELLKGISGYKDADDLYEKYKITLDSKVQDEFITTQQSKRKLKKFALIVVPLCCILVIGLGIGLANSTDKPIDPKETTQNDQDVETEDEVSSNENLNPTQEETNSNSSNIEDPADTSNSDSSPTVAEIQQEERDFAINAAKALLFGGVYPNGEGYSRLGLIDALIQSSEYFIDSDDAEYAADNCGANWNEQAVIRANHLHIQSLDPRGELIGSLEAAYKFTESQAIYAADALGY